MSKSTPALLRAIGDFNAEHGSDKEHETTVELLKRVEGDVGKRGGKALQPPSPGAREAQGAAERSMPAEVNHDGGGGNTRSNRPGSADIPDPAVNMHDKSEPSVLHGTGPVPSGGNLVSNLSAEEMPKGIVDIRRMAALKELEKGPSSEGNAESVTPAPAPARGARVGDVKAPAKPPADTNKGAAFEGVPPFTKEPLAGDGWTRARQKAKEMFATAR